MSAITIYVDNLSDDMDTEWLGQIFSKYGRVVDVYIPFKRSKNFRTKFGFVRFNTVVEAEEAIADLDGISIRDKKMRVKMATFKVIQNQGGEHLRHPSTVKKPVTGKVDANAIKLKGPNSEKEAGKSYADAVVGRSCALRRISVNAIGNEWLTRSVVAKLYSLSAMESIREALHCKGVPQFDVRDMGGLWVVLTFPSVEQMLSVFDGEFSWLNKWFAEISKWSPEMQESTGADSTRKGDDSVADSVGEASSRRDVVHGVWGKNRKGIKDGKEVSRVEDSNFEVSEGVKEFSSPKEDSLEEGEIRDKTCRSLTETLGEVNTLGEANILGEVNTLGEANHVVLGPNNLGEVFLVSDPQNLEVVGGCNMVRPTVQPNGANSGLGPIENNPIELGLVNLTCDGNPTVGHSKVTPDPNNEPFIFSSLSESVSDSYNNMEDGRYVYSCRQDDSIIPDNLPDGYKGVVNLWFRREVERSCCDDVLVLDSYREQIVFSKVENMEMVLGSGLSLSTRVTLPRRIEDLVTEKFVSFANSMLKDPKNADKKVLLIAGEVVVRTLQGSMESEQEAVARSFTESADEVLTDFVEAIIEEDYQEALEHVSAVIKVNHAACARRPLKSQF
ncbi:hypothetical protein Vadar_024218 [Vaccinium darrowii]|uniref:Uncharacterized protein n=1 Tax=Vaccinium darrowii TaxID=229202 RepID=A0ACB7X3X7_9ERIC|nr:hypothetical protein Vadar_024218 [Vaccinium darrowii]